MFIFNNNHYDDWVRPNSMCWHRVPLYPKVTEGHIRLVIMIDFDTTEFIWYPEFTDDLGYVQEIYDKIGDQIVFKKGQEEKAKIYVDNFLLKINRLKAFI